ncbi:PREDICTED: LOW QUALITY PROTEIN: inactive leucine-rich repeat receptor-like protein kinase CORYNE [Erythranthe guttata]|uniref:LOW QUALITY PROTEIN: inactive leucine-rich repeat receptor-like protein kinase CORYNE n=1 Tax=Erythranthe guttata TaxID=4155 RepID=UPI00064DFDB1|nr:PREDICTED: LOW QUALITY PROTEIN: inactive leucine-rich repeat receptor-like protein kinase CORYNE [Erythranthe guttata]|eukprot:XP_012848095.1 PREDICTED: LOW QUALITY PROTEIN: inactive leucine-rich repeat receptor-like protein kinase CORYNE [Erythranthe guttata]
MANRAQAVVITTTTTTSTRFQVLPFILICLNNVLSAECIDRITKSEPPKIKNRLLFKILLSVFLGIITGLICALLFALLARYFLKYINRKTPTPKPLILFSPKISPKTLKSAMSNEPHLLGSSSNGDYYKVVLDNGLTVAVKKLNPFVPNTSATTKKKKRVKRELDTLSILRHRNLMSLRGYVFESNICSLVYDYAPNGSLEDAMRSAREDRLELKWEVRLRIAVGIIRGLYYLHFNCEPQRLHCNLKPSNVILGPQFEPRLADCGLAPILPDFSRAGSCYTGPECSLNCRYTDKSDIFSFGVILGVLITGKDPLDPMFGEGGSSLGQWLRQMQQSGEVRETIDKNILGQEIEEDEMVMAVSIAVVCMSELPADRPSSDELVSMLTQLNSF